jgi:cytochrome c553
MSQIDLPQHRRAAKGQDVHLEYAGENPMNRVIRISTIWWAVRATVWAAMLGCALSAPLMAAQPYTEPMPGDYRVIDGRVDAGTYAGWRAFHATCYACHGTGGVGTATAPNLVARIGSMTPRAFAAKVLSSYSIVSPADAPPADKGSATPDTMLEQIMRRERGTGGRVIMPAWEGDARVDPHVLDLYAYLAARADGKIGAGEPGRLPRLKR